MGLFDSIYQTGANSLRKAAGSAGRAIDVAGGALGDFIPDLGISEALEYEGSKALTPEQRVETVVDQGKPVAGQDTQIARNLGLNFTYDTSAGISGDKPAYNTQEQSSAFGKSPTSSFTSGETAALGIDQGQLWNGNVITMGGQQYTVKDNGDGTRSFIPKSSGDGGGQVLGAADVAAGIKGAGDDILKNLRQSNIDDVLGKQFKNTEDLANELERIARENAERDYNDVLSALGSQEKEVGTLSKQQKENIAKQGEFAEEDLTLRQEKEKGEIEKQKTGYEESVEKTKDQLAQNWRDMSLQIQRIMRGRGVADSSFAAGSEVEVLKDFNKGLRTLAVESSGAIKDFADAVTETVSFYERKKSQLAEEVRVNVQKVDDWVRQRTTDIQNQKNVALSTKLKQINNAVAQAQQLKTNVANEILQKQLDYDMWLKQVEVNYKLSVAQAAKGKVQSAVDKIKESAATSKAMFTLLENGQASFIQGEDGQVGLYDSLSGALIPVRPGFEEDYETQQELERKKLEQQATGSGLFGGFNLGGSSLQSSILDTSNEA